MDQDETWHKGRSRPRPHCVRWNPAPPPQLSVHLRFGQTAGWTKLPLGMEVGLGAGDFVLDGNPVLSPETKAQPHPHPIFGPCLLLPKGWVDQDATWYGGKPWPRRRCVRWDPSCPLKGHNPPVFGPCLLWPNGWMDQDATWYGRRPR